jgi:hypothetical protein
MRSTRRLGAATWWQLAEAEPAATGTVSRQRLRHCWSKRFFYVLRPVCLHVHTWLLQDAVQYASSRLLMVVVFWCIIREWF